MTVRRVLVVDDDPRSRELVTEVMEGAGFEVVVASGLGDLSALSAAAPALILTDITARGADHLDETSALKADPRTAWIPVVIISAHAAPAEVERARLAKCDAYVTKPIDTRALPMLCVALIAKSEARRR